MPDGKSSIRHSRGAGVTLGALARKNPGHKYLKIGQLFGPIDEIFLALRYVGE
jgi:hypothetical protein